VLQDFTAAGRRALDERMAANPGSFRDAAPSGFPVEDISAPATHILPG
jgi:hypothetical protein